MHYVLDQAGVATTEAYDAKGNVLRAARRLLADPSADVEWPRGEGPGLDALLAAETFQSAATYDALDRVIQAVAPHSDTPGTTVSVVRHGYNEASLLETVDAWTELRDSPSALLDPATATQHVVTGIAYNARGQRVEVAYGNAVTTAYEHEPLTFRLRRLTTRRGLDVLQDLTYDHDPVGNITRIRDEHRTN